MQEKFTNKAGDFIRYHKKFTIWPGIKLATSINQPYMGWLVGNGANINFWRDTWPTEIPLREYIETPQSLWKRYIARLSAFINSDGWDIPTDIRTFLLALGINGMAIPCNPQEADKRIWKPDSYGKFTVRNAYETIRKKENTTRSAVVQNSFWELLMPNEAKLCCDGSSIGNPGTAGIGVVFRDSKGAVLGALSKAIGISTSFLAKILAILTGIQKAVEEVGIIYG
ncbi:hypothetical protein GIB67_013030 [Kingdonia uniflora]|uniref:RNase H type-1 domain-containing protein n=1 Tax=Kingdonia uniflora TaxID=39325 RepID=A0A7J7MCF4_9MAGN|nr:hypothetical protein GIB67_013030 [Kingdonia uniflora]